MNVNSQDHFATYYKLNSPLIIFASAFSLLWESCVMQCMAVVAVIMTSRAFNELRQVRGSFEIEIIDNGSVKTPRIDMLIGEDLVCRDV